MASAVGAYGWEVCYSFRFLEVSRSVYTMDVVVSGVNVAVSMDGPFVQNAVVDSIYGGWMIRSWFNQSGCTVGSLMKRSFWICISSCAAAVILDYMNPNIWHVSLYKQRWVRPNPPYRFSKRPTDSLLYRSTWKLFKRIIQITPRKRKRQMLTLASTMCSTEKIKLPINRILPLQHVNVGV